MSREIVSQSELFLKTLTEELLVHVFEIFEYFPGKSLQDTTNGKVQPQGRNNNATLNTH